MERRRSSIRRLTEGKILDCEAKGIKCGEDFPEDKDDVPICGNEARWYWDHPGTPRHYVCDECARNVAADIRHE